MTIPLHDSVAEIPVRIYEELEILHALDEPKSMTDFQQELDDTSIEIQDIVSHLPQKLLS